MPLHPIEGLTDVPQLVGATGMTQYQVGDTGIYDVHGLAAREIQHFLDAAWAGHAEITVPAGCPASGCVFAATP